MSNLTIKELYDLKIERFIRIYSGDNHSFENEFKYLKVLQEHIKLTSGKELEQFMFPMIETISKIIMDDK